MANPSAQKAAQILKLFVIHSAVAAGFGLFICIFFPMICMLMRNKILKLILQADPPTLFQYLECAVFLYICVFCLGMAAFLVIFIAILYLRPFSKVEGRVLNDRVSSFTSPIGDDARSETTRQNGYGTTIQA